MKNAFLSTLLLFVASFAIHAQSVSGIVKDELGAPLTGASISLLSAEDSSVVKLTVSKEQGAYRFEAVEPGSYLVAASYVGYEAAVTDAFTLGDSAEKRDLSLRKRGRELRGIVVRSQRPLVELKGDRTVVNVEGTVNAIGNNVPELLRKAPGVTLDKDEKIALSGKSGVQVYIDGRPTPLAGAELTAYLRSLPSTSVEAIELITNPSARYPAAGNAGIINIRLKKNKQFGTNGSVTAGFNGGYYGKYNGGVSLNHRNATLNVFGHYTYNKGTTRKDMVMERIVQDSVFAQSGRITEESGTHHFNTGMDIFLSLQSTLGWMANGNFSDSRIDNYSRTPIFYQPTGQTDRILVADNQLASRRSHADFNLNYLYSDKSGKSLSLNADYGYYHTGSNQLQPNFYYDPSGQVLADRVVYRMVAPGSIDIYSLKGDYEQDLLKGKLGVGGKSALVQTDNDFKFYHLLPAGEVADKGRSNRFLYQEYIHAGYATYNRKLGAVQLQAGLRVEHTRIDGRTTGSQEVNGGYAPYDSAMKRRYTDVFPSVSLSYSEAQEHQWSLAISRRIDRPYYQDLNPFEFKVDEYITQAGNTQLRPSYTWSFGVTHSYKGKLNTGLNYSDVTDAITWLLDTTGKTRALVSKQNLARQKVLALNVSFPFSYRNYSLFSSLNANHSACDADFGEGRRFKESAFGLNLFVQNSLKMGDAWTAEVSGFYNSPTVQEGNMRTEGMWSVDAGVQKKVLKDNGTVKLSVSDVFGSLKFRSRSVFAGQTTLYNTRWESRQIKSNFVYRFGNREVKGARQRKSGAAEEMKRVQ